MPGVIVAVWICGALSGVGAVYWCVVGWRVRRDGRNRPSLREGLSGTLERWPSVSVIIPAHNEEAHAPDLLRTLLQQDYSGELEVIFVLDRCTDGTRAALMRVLDEHDRSKQRGPTVQLIDNHSCPDDWAGKCNAAHQGALRSRGEILLFTDADTTFDPALIRASVKLLTDHALALLSALSSVSVRHGFEAIVQPAAALQLMKQYPISSVNDAIEPRAFANGQFMMFTRESYEALGGHTAVKDALLEDLAFARRMVHTMKRKAGLFIADDLLRVRMYETYGQFREGWKRIFIEASHRNPARLVRYGWECALVGTGVACFGLIGAMFGVIGWVIGDPPLGIVGVCAGCGALIIQQLVLRRIFQLIGVPKIAALAYPYAALVIARIQWSGAHDLRSGKPVRWGGRNYVLQPSRN
ncbi:MAG: glycosyltransferase [Phycisphaerales bacterium]|nr:glycosyltransferase [Phycisphaerales bacterium]